MIIGRPCRGAVAALATLSLTLSGVPGAAAQTASDELYQVWPDADYCFAVLVGLLPRDGEDTSEELVGYLTGDTAIARCVETVSVLVEERVYPQAVYRERGIDTDASSGADPFPSSARPPRPTAVETERLVERYCLVVKTDRQAERTWSRASRRVFRAGSSATVAQKRAESTTWKRWLDIGRTRERLEGVLVDAGIVGSEDPGRVCADGEDGGEAA